MKYDVEAYIADNPKAWALFVKFTQEAIAAGRKTIGAKMIAERIRWETMLRKNGDYKFNNNYTAGMARRFMEQYPQHDGLFVTRGAA